MAEFEVFVDKNSKRGRRGEAVTILRFGRIALSEAAFEALGSPASVRFLVSRDERRLAFQSCPIDDPDAHAIRGKSHYISGVPVLRFFGIEVSPDREARRYNLQTGDDGLRYIDLKEPGIVVTSNRRKH